MLQRIRNSRGMSLIEILIVLGIIAGAMGVIINRVITSGEQANVEQTQNEIKALVGYVKLYKQKTGKYPTTDQGLGALVEAGYYDSAPVDAWKTEFHYESPGSHGNKFEIWSDGSDPDKDEDNINSWDDNKEE